jgi:phospholipase C
MSMRRRGLLQLGAAAAVGGCAMAPPREPRPLTTWTETAAFGGSIEHFIVLMMENRSYDQMLGALSGPEHDGVADGTLLTYQDRNGAEQSVPIRHGAPPDRFRPDPGHNFKAVDAQIHGRGRGVPADMSGFVPRLLRDNPSLEPAGVARYTTIYADGRLPVLQGLAKAYGVCSHWFASLPSSTTPNRMFTHAGTSRGATRQGAYYSRIAGKMIFDKLERARWRVYFHDVPHLWLTGDAWTQTFAGQLHYIPRFERDVRDDALPTYSFIEPRHVVPPWNSQHPSAGVSHGERLIARVYNALVSNPRVFEKSLLLIVYDEHGGFYDHVVPPGHEGFLEAYPGVAHDVVQPDTAYGSADGPDDGYDFTTLGPRVPAVVVSPWIEAGSVFGWKAADEQRRLTFDHTSILATVGAMTGTWVDSERARAASTLELVVNRASPRRDLPRIEFDPRAYRRGKIQRTAGGGGPASDLAAAFRQQHGHATPEQIAEHYRRLLTG